MPQVRLEGITAIAALLIASFAIDRIVAGILFLLSFSDGWNKRFPDPVLVKEEDLRYKAEKKLKLLRTILAAIIALPVLAFYGEVRILAAVGFETVNPILDQVLTGFILIGGADRIGEVLKWSGVQARPQAEKTSSQPIEITGKLTLESPGKEASPSAHAAHG
jgi:hypothetical protein